MMNPDDCLQYRVQEPADGKTVTDRKRVDYSSYLTYTSVVCLFVLVLYIPVNNFSVMSGRFPVFLG